MSRLPRFGYDALGRRVWKATARAAALAVGARLAPAPVLPPERA